MSSQVKNQLTLADLPSDIIIKIIAVGQESIDDMILISPRWNSLSLEHLGHRNRSPAIKWFRWRIRTWSQQMECSVSMRIPERYRYYYGVKNWPILSRSDNIVEVSKNWTMGIELRGTVSKHVSRIFDRCSGLERLELDIHLIHDLEINLLKTLLASSIRVDELAFSGYIDGDEIFGLLELLRSHSFKRLLLPSENSVFGIIAITAEGARFAAENSDSFFCKALQLATEIVVTDAIHSFPSFSLPHDFSSEYWRFVVEALNKLDNVSARREVVNERAFIRIFSPLNTDAEI